ncbi:hypothetical protein PHMEG_00013629 [Phytophthora megakarya]|uniref:Uncharacterized protein n=1 Tax=Phytophthora megakarya TaxID=4795 RepID=A0A225W7X8_9STRA|nr:hypothetical protein PHMEG_00013629 [Phytophthora megakarya]
MAASTFHRRANTTIPEESKHVEEYGNDSCPMLDEEENFESNVRRVDNSAVSSKKRLVQRIQSRKNRFVQRVLVACHLADPSKDMIFKQTQTSNRAVIEQLTAFRSSLSEHSQSILKLSTVVCSFTSSPSCLQDVSQEAVTKIATEGHYFRENALAFHVSHLSNQAEMFILVQINHRIIELKGIHSLIEEHTKLVLDVEYAKRTLEVELQKGNVSHIAARKHALQVAQLECERATLLITEQLKFARPSQRTDMIKLYQEVRFNNSIVNAK